MEAPKHVNNTPPPQFFWGCVAAMLLASCSIPESEFKNADLGNYHSQNRC
jgi:hypothetical protein